MSHVRRAEAERLIATLTEVDQALYRLERSDTERAVAARQRWQTTSAETKLALGKLSPRLFAAVDASRTAARELRHARLFAPHRIAATHDAVRHTRSAVADELDFLTTMPSDYAIEVNDDNRTLTINER